MPSGIGSILRAVGRGAWDMANELLLSPSELDTLRGIGALRKQRAALLAKALNQSVGGNVTDQMRRSLRATNSLIWQGRKSLITGALDPRKVGLMRVLPRYATIAGVGEGIYRASVGQGVFSDSSGNFDMPGIPFL